MYVSMCSAQCRFVIDGVVCAQIRLCPSDALYAVNVNGTANVLKACRACAVKQLVYTSSIDAVNDGTAKDEATEDLNYVTHYNPYGTTKGLAEQLLLKQCDDALAVAILRISHIFGPGDPLLFPVDTFTKFPVMIGSDTCKHSFIQ